jgi:enoyl-CoA hydratase/carnithine racemase
MNAINTPLAEGLVNAVTRLSETPELRAGVITGAGRGFCAGMDLKAEAVKLAVARRHHSHDRWQRDDRSGPRTGIV